MVILRYWVVVVKPDGTSYVDPLAPDTDDQVVPELVLDSQRYVIVDPDVVVVPEVVLVKAAGSPPLQIV